MMHTDKMTCRVLHSVFCAARNRLSGTGSPFSGIAELLGQTEANMVLGFGFHWLEKVTPVWFKKKRTVETRNCEAGLIT